MGHFGKSITASDDYFDFTADLSEFLGYKFSDNLEDEEEYDGYLTKEMMESRYDDIRDWFNSKYKLVTELQFLAYHLVRLGVDLKDESDLLLLQSVTQP